MPPLILLLLAGVAVAAVAKAAKPKTKRAVDFRLKLPSKKQVVPGLANLKKLSMSAPAMGDMSPPYDYKSVYNASEALLARVRWGGPLINRMNERRIEIINSSMAPQVKVFLLFWQIIYPIFSGALYWPEVRGRTEDDPGLKQWANFVVGTTVWATGWMLGPLSSIGLKKPVDFGIWAPLPFLTPEDFYRTSTSEHTSMLMDLHRFIRDDAALLNPDIGDDFPRDYTSRAHDRLKQITSECAFGGATPELIAECNARIVQEIARTSLEMLLPEAIPDTLALDIVAVVASVLAVATGAGAFVVIGAAAAGASAAEKGEGIWGILEAILRKAVSVQLAMGTAIIPGIQAAIDYGIQVTIDETGIREELGIEKPEASTADLAAAVKQDPELAKQAIGVIG